MSQELVIYFKYVFSADHLVYSQVTWSSMSVSCVADK